MRPVPDSCVARDKVVRVGRTMAWRGATLRPSGVTAVASQCHSFTSITDRGAQRSLRPGRRVGGGEGLPCWRTRADRRGRVNKSAWGVSRRTLRCPRGALLLLHLQVPSALWDCRRRHLPWPRPRHEIGGPELASDGHVHGRFVVLREHVRRSVLIRLSSATLTALSRGRAEFTSCAR